MTKSSSTISKKVTKENSDRFIDEVSFDSSERAKNTMEYEQMLMRFIETEAMQRGTI